jgi:Retrotransposon gag protein
LAERISHNSTHTWTALKLSLLSYFVSPVKVSDAKDSLLSSNKKSAEGITEYVTEFQILLILAQISNETDKLFTFLRGLRKFTAGSVHMDKPNTLQEAIRLSLEFEAAFKGNNSQRGLNVRISLVCTIMQENIPKTTLETEMEVVPWGVLDLLDSRNVVVRSSRKLRPNVSRKFLQSRC